MKKVTIINHTNDMLAGIIDENKDTKDIVIACHGLWGNKNGVFYPQLSLALAKSVNVLRFDFTGAGESSGTYWYGYSKDVEDIRAAIEYCRSHGYSVKAIIGHSKAGTAVMLYAAKYNDVPYIVNLAGRFHPKEGITFSEKEIAEIKAKKYITIQRKEKSFIVTDAAFQERLATDLRVVSGVKAEVLIVHGNKDDTIPVSDAKMFSKCIPHNTLEIIDGADHLFTKHADKMSSIVTSWLDER